MYHYAYFIFISISRSSSQVLGFLHPRWLLVWPYCLYRISLPGCRWYSIIPFILAASYYFSIAFQWYLFIGRFYLPHRILPLYFINTKNFFSLSLNIRNCLTTIHEKVIRSHFGKVQQAMRQPTAALPKFPYVAFKVLAKLLAIGVPLRFTGCHISCSSPYRRSGSYYVLHPTTLHYFLSSSLRFSRLQSTRCPLFCVPFVPTAAAGLSWFLYLSHMPKRKQKNHAKPWRITLLSIVRLSPSFLYTTAVGARTFRPFVPHSRLFCAARTLRSVVKCATT